MTSILLHPGHWRERAEEAFTLAEQFKDPETKAEMLRVAEGYMRLADKAEARIARGKRDGY